jgi:TetR/AcrR family tetracycline transcriptional repressor
VVEPTRPALTRESIIAAALVLVDEVGLDELTTRRLAIELGVKSPALYWHFSSKQELLDGMGDAITLSAGMGAPRKNETWQHWVSRRARAYRKEMLGHRDGARIVSAMRNASPETVRLFGEEVAALADLGFDAVLAMKTIAVVTHYVTGFVLKEQMAPLEILTPAMEFGGNPLGEEVFEHGLQMIVAGTEHFLAGRV